MDRRTSTTISPCTLALILILTTSLVHHVHPWQDYLRSHPHVHLEEKDIQVFVGNKTHTDHFKLLERDGDSLLVGARNMVYNLSLHTMAENSIIEWYSSEDDRMTCDLKGKNRDACQNYIRVLVTTNKTVLVCGTNAYNPLCRHYTKLPNGEYNSSKPWSGLGLCPHDPKHNSTVIYADDELYVGTVSDFSATDPLIYREPLRTEQNDPKQLNAPDFVASIHHGSFVYFFFREESVEYMNCGKTVYSRVGRVCTNDKGSFKNPKGWTSFLKARLNCSVSGEFPFYFNEIQSASQVVSGVYAGRKSDIFYAVFTTPSNSISGSAVCAFSMKDVGRTFDADFKEQKTTNANWLPALDNTVPEPRPGSCANDSRSLPDSTLNFLKGHTLMDDSVSPLSPQPLVIRTAVGSRFTQVTVDPQVRTPDGRTYDIMFIGTDNGRVLKAINAQSPDSSMEVSPVIIEEIEVFDRSVPITNLQVYRSAKDPNNMALAKLIVVSDDQIKAISLARCYTNRISSCNECVALQDPYCAWDTTSRRCSSLGYPSWTAGDFIQNVKEGYHTDCPGGNSDPSPNGTTNLLTGKSSTESVISTTTEGVSCPPCPVSCACQTSDDNSTGGYAGKGTAKHSQEQSVYDKGNEANKPWQNNRNEHYDNANNRQPRTWWGPDGQRSANRFLIYTAETLAIAVTTSIVLSLVIGFISGYIFSRHCRSDDIRNTYDDDRLVEQQQKANRDQTHINHSDSYMTSMTPTNNKAAINLVLNVPPKNGSGKNANSSADNKPVQKVKKIYL